MGRFGAREYRDTAKAVKRRVGPVNSLYGGFCFWPRSDLLDTGAKMPPASLWRAYKRRKAVGEYRDAGGRAGGPGGHKNPPQKSPGRAVVVFKIFSPSPR